MYAELLFLTEFMNDFLILLIVKELNCYQMSKKNMIAGALTGALISTILAVFFSDASVVFNIFAGIFLCMSMIRISFNPKIKSQFLRLFLHTYAAAFIMGGITDFIQNRIIQLPASFIFLIGFIMVKAGIFINTLIKKKGECLCRINVSFENEIKSYTALIDTGNLLFDGESGHPVSIIFEDAIPERFRKRTEKSILFNSLGCTNGTLRIIYVPYICVEYKGEKKLIEHVPLGLSANKLSASDSYQMIISPEIINKTEI